MKETFKAGETFKKDDTVGNIPNKIVYQLLLEIASEYNVPIYSGANIDSYGDYPNITFHNSMIQGNSSSYGSSEKNWITIDEFITKCQNYRPSTFKITEDYYAELTKGGIQVGCQTVTWEDFDKLVKVAKKFRE